MYNKNSSGDLIYFKNCCSYKKEERVEIARRQFYTRGLNCKKGQFCTWKKNAQRQFCTSDSFARRVIFVQDKKKEIIKNTTKGKKKLSTEGKV